MDSNLPYSMPPGLHAIPLDQLDLRPDSEIDELLLNPPPVTSEKNVWFYWHAGFADLHPYCQRNIRTWHRRLAPLGWKIRVVDIEVSPRGPGHVSNFLDTSNPNLFPRSFHENTIDGEFRGQLTSDLTRFPLLLVHGGIYADVSYMQIGDVNALWQSTIMDPNSPFEFLTFNFGTVDEVRIPFNYFMAALPGNPFLQRCNHLLLELWTSDGGRTNSYGLAAHPLMKDAPSLKMSKAPGMEEVSRLQTFDELAKEFNDYGIQMVVMALVMGLVDSETGWNGPEYALQNIFAIDFAEHSMQIELLVEFDGHKAFQLMSLQIPKEGEAETEEQAEARALVENVLSRSFAVKMANGPIVKVFGKTLGVLWKENAGADDVPGTYAYWLRYGMLYWTQDKLPAQLDFGLREPFKTGPLLRGVDEEPTPVRRNPISTLLKKAKAESIVALALARLARAWQRFK